MLLIWLLACDDTIFSNGAPQAQLSGHTYADMQALFAANCTSCHSAASASSFGNLDLATDACAAIVGVTSSYGPPRVVPGDHAASVLWAKLSNTGEYGGGMPPTGSLDQASIDAVAAWIDAGAVCGTAGDTADTADTAGGTP